MLLMIDSVGVVKIHDTVAKTTRSVELQTQTQLFAIAKVPLTIPDYGNSFGTTPKHPSEFAICGWDGMTYLMDVSLNTVRFDYPNRVSAFTAGTGSA